MSKGELENVVKKVENAVADYVNYYIASYFHTEVL